ncbi:UNVERIFIED_ORG: BASS family bile acid:Na+ symporter [Variovorax guangxiensis]
MPGPFAVLTRNGPSVLAAGVFLGLLVPALADAARPLMPVTVFIFVLGTLLRVDPATVLAVARRPAVSLALPLCAIVVCPVVAGLAGHALGLPPAWTLALVLAFCAPPASGTSAVARMLGLDAAVALVATLAAMALVPLTAPLLAQWFGRDPGVAIQPSSLALRLILLVGTAEGAAILVRRFAKERLAAHAGAIDGVVVVALLVFAVGTMAGLQQAIVDQPALVIAAIALAFAANVGVQCIAYLLTPGSVRTRLNVALLMGNRNVGLLWAALGAAATPAIALFFACAQLPIYLLPRVIQSLVPRLEALSERRRNARELRASE